MNITIFAFFPRNCRVLGGQEERKEEEGKGEGGRGGGEEGGSRVLDISDSHWASIRRTGSEVSLEGHLCSSRSNLVDHFALKKCVFLLKNSMFHEIRTLMLEGPNFVNFFVFSFHEHHFFTDKTTGS